MKFNVGDKVICIKSSYKGERNLTKYEKFNVVYCATIGVFLAGRLGHYSIERFVTEQQYRKIKLKKLKKIKYE